MADNPQLQQLLQQSVDRQAFQNPLFQAVSQMAYAGLPKYARQGTQMSGTLSNQAPAVAPQSGGGGLNPALAGALGGLGGAALNSLGPNGNALGALIDGLKKLFGDHSGAGIQGNKPQRGGGVNPVGSQLLPNNSLMFPAGMTWPGPSDPSGGTGIGPGLQGVDTSGLDDAFSRMLEAAGLPSISFPDLGSMGYPNDPSGGSGVGPGMSGYRGGGQWPVQADPNEE